MRRANGNRARATKKRAPPTPATDAFGCRWIDGEPASFARRCGKPVAGPGEPYCTSHRKRAYVRVSAREATT